MQRKKPEAYSGKYCAEKPKTGERRKDSTPKTLEKGRRTNYYDVENAINSSTGGERKKKGWRRGTENADVGRRVRKNKTERLREH